MDPERRARFLREIWNGSFPPCCHRHSRRARSVGAAGAGPVAHQGADRAVARRCDAEGIVKTNGRIEATQVDVASKYAGRLAEVTVKEGRRGHRRAGHRPHLLAGIRGAAAGRAGPGAGPGRRSPRPRPSSPSARATRFSPARRPTGARSSSPRAISASRSTTSARPRPRPRTPPCGPRRRSATRASSRSTPPRRMPSRSRRSSSTSSCWPPQRPRPVPARQGRGGGRGRHARRHHLDLSEST